MRTLLAIATLIFSYGASGNELPRYARVIIADPEYKVEYSPIESLVIDEKNMNAYSGDISILFERCKEPWLCIDLGTFLISIPSSCKMLNPDGSWSYNNLKFTAIGSINPQEENPGRISHIINVASDDGELEAVVVYSKDRGVESFSRSHEISGGVKSLISYYLSSSKGALSNGCVIN